MDWVPLALTVLFVAPLWATGELGVYRFEQVESHLVWDEAMGAPPQPLDEPGGARMLAAQLVVGLGGVLGLVAWLGRPR